MILGGLPERPNPDLENYKAKVFDSNPEAFEKKEEFSALLTETIFDESAFRMKVEGYNSETQNTKGYLGKPTTIETIRKPHGELKVYHYPESNSVMFGFGDLK